MQGYTKPPSFHCACNQVHLLRRVVGAQSDQVRGVYVQLRDELHILDTIRARACMARAMVRTYDQSRGAVGCAPLSAGITGCARMELEVS